MQSFNSTVVAGRVSDMTCTAATGESRAECRLVLDVRRAWKDQDGARRTEKCRLHVRVEGRTAEVLGAYAKVGTNLLVHGRLVSRRRGRLEVMADSVKFLAATTPATAGQAT